MIATELKPVVTALEKCGLHLGDDIEDLDELAQLVEVAARNHAAGKKRRGHAGGCS